MRADKALELLAQAIETQRDLQKSGVFIEDLAAVLNPSTLRLQATELSQAAADWEEIKALRLDLIQQKLFCEKTELEMLESSSLDAAARYNARGRILQPIIDRLTTVLFPTDAQETP